MQLVMSRSVWCSVHKHDNWKQNRRKTFLEVWGDMLHVVKIWTLNLKVEEHKWKLTKLLNITAQKIIKVLIKVKLLFCNHVNCIIALLYMCNYICYDTGVFFQKNPTYHTYATHTKTAGRFCHPPVVFSLACFLFDRRC